jgi:hypothetical protein
LDRAGERGAAYAFNLQTNERGEYVLPGVVEPGLYRVWVKGAHTLRRLLPTSLAPGLNNLDESALHEGDAVADNRIDVLDLSLLSAAHGSRTGLGDFDARADFNSDGVIDAHDSELLRDRFGETGDGVRASVGSQAAMLGATAGVTLSVVPSRTIAAGARTAKRSARVRLSFRNSALSARSMITYEASPGESVMCRNMSSREGPSTQR